jgi:hypothetical protein
MQTAGNCFCTAATKILARRVHTRNETLNVIVLACWKLHKSVWSLAVRAHNIVALREILAMGDEKRKVVGKKYSSMYGNSLTLIR